MNDNNEIQIIEENVNEEVNNEIFNESPKKSKGPLIALIIFVILVVGVTAGIIYLVDKGYIIIDRADNTPVDNHTEEPVVSSKQYASWSDYTCTIKNVTFTFPLDFVDFKDMISKTDYKLSSRSSLDMEVPTTYSEDSYLIYEKVVRGSNAKVPLSYMIKVNLKNKTGEVVQVEESTVIGITVEYALIYDTEEGDLPYDKDIVFTSKSISLGDNKTKSELISLLGKSNTSDELGDDEYEVGKYISGGKEYHNFDVLIRNEEIVKIDMNNYLN